MSAFQRWTARLLLMLGVVAVWPVVAQTPELPSFNRKAPPGDPPAVPESTDPTEKGVEILGRGPLHQGFAQPTNPKPQAAPVVPKAPPAAVREVPPEQKPDDPNAVWLPGYWSWDDDRNDFIWISGVWRVPPLGRRWMPGYWTKVSDGYRYVSGFWGDGNPPAVPLLEAPPESLDRGPNLPPPEDGYSWVPGNWLWQDERWFWRPGFWCAPRPGWLFTPACYCWTPRGFQYIPSFWDRCLLTRGLAFAPCYFLPGVCNRPNFCFSPRCALGVGNLFGSFWCRPSCNYYAFGDFYGRGYAGCGFQPWFSYGARTCDPLFGFYRNSFAKTNPGWVRGLASTFDGRSNGTLPVPSRTFVRGDTASAVQPLASFKNSAQPLVKVPVGERTERAAIASARLGTERAQREAPRPAVTTSSRPEVATVRSAPPSSRRPESTTARSAPSTRPQEPSAIRSQPAPRSNSQDNITYSTPRGGTPSTPSTLPRSSVPATAPRVPSSMPRETPRATTPPPRYVTPPATPRLAPPSSGRMGGGGAMPRGPAMPSGRGGGGGGKGR